MAGASDARLPVSSVVLQVEGRDAPACCGVGAEGRAAGSSRLARVPGEGNVKRRAPPLRDCVLLVLCEHAQHVLQRVNTKHVLQHDRRSKAGVCLDELEK